MLQSISYEDALLLLQNQYLTYFDININSELNSAIEQALKEEIIIALATLVNSNTVLNVELAAMDFNNIVNEVVSKV